MSKAQAPQSVRTAAATCWATILGRDAQATVRRRKARIHSKLSRVPADSAPHQQHRIRRKLPDTSVSARFVWHLRKKGRTSRFREKSSAAAADHGPSLTGWSAGFSPAHPANSSSRRGGTLPSNESPRFPINARHRFACCFRSASRSGSHTSRVGARPDSGEHDAPPSSLPDCHTLDRLPRRHLRVLLWTGRRTGAWKS